MRTTGDIDERMLPLRTEALGIEDWTLEVAASFIRAAYGMGYSDALKDATPVPPDDTLLAELHARLPVP